MVSYVAKWNILPDKAEAYTEWSSSAINRLLEAPGVLEFRAYRPATGSHQVVLMYEFANMNAWASWQKNEDIQKLFDEARTYVTDIDVELWGPSPILPDPIRTGQ